MSGFVNNLGFYYEDFLMGIRQAYEKFEIGKIHLELDDATVCVRCLSNLVENLINLGGKL